MAHDEPAQALERLADLGHLSAGVGHHVINAFSAIVSNAEILRLSAQMPSSVDPMAIAIRSSGRPSRPRPSHAA